MALQIPLSRRTRKILRYVGIAVASLIVFVLALQATFPYSRVQDRLIDALSPTYDITPGQISRGILPGSFTISQLTIRTRPVHADDPVTTFHIDSLHVDVGLLALIGMNASVDFDMQILSGRIKGSIKLPKLGKDGFTIDVDGTDVPANQLPMRSLIGLPMAAGKLQFSVDLSVPGTKTKAGRDITDWSHADGDISISCPTGCTFGDGVTKLKPLIKNRSQQAMVGDGIEFGTIDVDSLAIDAKFTPAVGDPESHSANYKPGKFDITKFDVRSHDGELHVDYSMTLAPDIDESVVTGCLRFNVNDSIRKKPKGDETFTAITSSGAERRADGLFHIKLSDKMKDMKRLNLECGPNAKPQPGSHDPGDVGVTGATRSRPTMPPPHSEPPTRAQHNEPPPPPPPPGPTAATDAGITAVNPANMTTNFAPGPNGGAQPNPAAPNPTAPGPAGGPGGPGAPPPAGQPGSTPPEGTPPPGAPDDQQQQQQQPVIQ